MKEKRQQPQCIGCGINPPPSSEGDPDSSTLLSMRFGWRVVRRTEDGGALVEWRCPACWQDYKAAQRRQGAPTIRRGS